MKVVAKCLAWLLGYLFLQALTSLFLPFIYLTLTSGDFADLSTRLILISSPPSKSHLSVFGLPY